MLSLRPSNSTPRFSTKPRVVDLRLCNASYTSFASNTTIPSVTLTAWVTLCFISACPLSSLQGSLCCTPAGFLNSRNSFVDHPVELWSVAWPSMDGPHGAIVRILRQFTLGRIRKSENSIIPFQTWTKARRKRRRGATTRTVVKALGRWRVKRGTRTATGTAN